MKEYIQFLVLLLLFDSVWISRPFHSKQYESIQKSEMRVDMLAGGLFYLLAPLGYFLFVKKLSKTREDAFKYGALLGFLMYSTYDLTNKAVFIDYKWSYAIADIVWGTLLFGVVSSVLFSFNPQKE